MTGSYFNTTGAVGRTLAEREGKAVTQEDRILEYYVAQWPVARTPSEVQAALGMQGVPLTSIRRAITNLTKQGRLLKTVSKKQGKYGREEYCWMAFIKNAERQASFTWDC